MKKIRYAVMLLAFVSLASCKKYLEEPNKIQASITTTAQLQALLDNVANTSPDWSSQFAANYAAMNASDDVEINLAAFNASPGALDLNSAFYYTFDADKLIQTSASDAVWSNAFQRILTANVILANVDNVSGSDEAKNMIRANAYFDRGYAYWTLVNQYCQPYHASTLQSLGLPLRKTVSYTESLTRATLKETYDFILSDILQAQALVSYSDVNPLFRWRVSKTAIEAFLSRYYLFTGDYNASLSHANNALTTTNAQLVNFNTIEPATNPTIYRPDGANGPAYVVNYSSLSQWTNTQYLAWPEFFYTSFTAGLNTGRNTFNASPSLIATYGPNETERAKDLRYKHFMPENSGFTAQWKTPGLNSFKQFGLNLIPTGPTIAEVMLNKAEASARLGDFATASSLIKALRTKRFVTGYADLDLGFNATNALTLVLQERRRELPFAFRWYDIRRFAYNETTSDDVVVTHQFYNVTLSAVDRTSPKTYTMPVKSAHYMIQIPNNDVIQSQGQIQQNTY
ncbi:RagB/SusD family nutrient uptake outer membrane protein [Pedobacter sp. KBS0701]|uniref:RagB/SusD family nutrient uptake outer membrane protein n=2 Tax=unclassified Pedobacter TaxID=2628915 RepID=UPI00110EC471|nr:RagB/SusD family nutrient uptake outer membrane protein [Pedobacter sp. KBS0701]QDW27910.1 RagB/SusD family nutrient uptake outer membrane protein [Pedobacter sp. KBS0701]